MSKRVLVIGVGPIPPRHPEKLHAPGLRLWSFADQIARAGHEVALCEAMFAGQQESAPVTPAPEIPENIKFLSLPLDLQGAAARLREIARETRPEAAVALTDIMNCSAALAKLPCPLWCDYLGHPMAERQMLARVFESDDGLIDQWRMLIPALLGADTFSACSAHEKDALIGELGAVGRLNRHTSPLDLVSVIPQPFSPVLLKAESGAIRGKIAKPDDFVVISTGGFNTWMDEATLFAGLVRAMEENPRVVFVVIGGAIKGHNEKTFTDFKTCVEASPFRERFHFAGWVSHEKVAAFYRDADLAINIDHFSYEGRLGTRTRIVEWARYGVPVLATPLGELAEDLAARKLMLSFKFGDARDLAEKISSAAENPAAGRERAERAREYVEQVYSPKCVIEPILKWLENPASAPDLANPTNRDALPGLVRPKNSLSEFWNRAYMEGEIDGAVREAGALKKLKKLFR
jgi:glycosyltransferase involved in cell wall biosynthesis